MALSATELSDWAHTFVEDCAFIEGTLDVKTITNGTIRNSIAPVARRYLVEGEASRAVVAARELCGMKAKRLLIDAPDHFILMPGKHSPSLRLYVAHGECQMGPIIFGDMYERAAGSPELPMIDHDQHAQFPLSTFLKQNMVVCYDERIPEKFRYYSREDTIKYVSNKCGGTHYDFQRNDAQQVLDWIRATHLLTPHAGARINTDAPNYDARAETLEIGSSHADVVALGLVNTVKLFFRSAMVSDIAAALRRGLATTARTSGT